MKSRPVFFRISRNRRKAASAPAMRPKALSGSIAKYSRGLALSVLTLIGASQAPGAIYYWDSDTTTAGFGNTTGVWGSSNFLNTDSTGGAGGSFFTATTNADTLNFGTATLNYAQASVTVSGAVVASSIVYGAGQTTSINISGGTSITLGDGTSGNGGITVNSGAGAQTISTAIILNNSQSWTNGSASGAFTVSGPVTGGANTLTLNGTGNGLTTLTGGLSFSGAGGLIIGKSGTNGTTISGGTITLGGTGGIVINSGSSAVGLGANTVSVNQSWTNNSASTFTVSGATSAGANTLTLDGTGAGLTTLTGGLTFSGAGGLIIGKSGTLGTTINGGTTTLGGTGGLTINSGSSAVSLASAASITANQNWANNSVTAMSVGGALTLTNQLTLTAGTFTFGTANTGTGGVVVNGATAQAGNAAAFGTGTLTLTSGKVSSNSGTPRILTNALVINGPVTFSDATNNGALTFQGATQQITSSNPTLTFATSGTTFNTNAFNLNGNDFTIAQTGTGAVSFNAGLSWTGARTINTGSGTGNIFFQGAMNGTSTPSLTFTGTATNVFFGNSIAVSGTTGGVNVNGPTVTFGVGTSSFTGGATLTSGTMVLDGATTGGPVTQGPIGTGTLTLAGGTVRNAATSRIVNNVVSITGDTTFGAATFAGVLTLGGAVSTTGDRALTFNNTTTVLSGLLTLGGNLTLNGGSGATLSGGIALGGSNRTLTGNTTGTTTISGALSSTAGSNKLVLAGTGLTVGAVLAGTNNPAIEVNGAGIYTFSGSSTYTGGTTLTAGTINYGIGSSGGPPPTSGPFGTGTLTLAGGTLQATVTALNLGNAITVTGNATINRTENNNSTQTFSGALNINSGGTLTFRNTGLTTQNPNPTYSFTNATQAINANTTLTAIRGAQPVTVNFSALTWGANTVDFIGSTFNLTNAGSAGSGALKIGDGTTFSGNGVGGIASVNSQNALGSGAITINYGGTLSTVTTAFNPTNAFTVNNGGTLNLRGAATPGGLITLNSGATLASSNTTTAALTLTQGTNVSFPTAGVLFNGIVFASTVTNAYPTFTGTMAFGGTAGVTLTTSAPTTVSSATTLAFNQYSGGKALAESAAASTPGMIFNGLVLNADIKVAGSGLNYAQGAIPYGSAGSLGAITNGGTAKDIVVEMSPLGIVFVTGSNGWANTTINSGTLDTSGTIGSGTLTINGGALRITAGTGTTSKNITVGTNGGVIETLSNQNNPASASYSGTVTGTSTAGLVLRSGSERGQSDKSMTVSGNLTGFNGNITLATANFAQPISLGANALPAVGFNVIVPSGIAFSGAAFTSATSSRFTTTTDSIFIPGASVNLSSGVGGLNKDIAIGLNGTALTSYTLPSTGNTTTYRLVPLNVATSLSTVDLFNGANNLTLSAAAAVTDSNSFVFASYGYATNFTNNNAVTISASQSYTGTTTVVGGIKPVGFGPQNGLGAASLVATNALSTTQIDVRRAGTFTVSGASGAVGSATTINVNGGATFTSGDTGSSSYTRLSNSATITLGANTGSSLGGGTFTFVNNTTTGTETVGSLVVAAGSNVITPSTTASVLLSFGGTAATAYTRNAGGLVSFSAASPNVQFANAQTGTSTAIGAAGNRILVGTLLNTGVVGAVDFAVAGAGVNLVAPTYSTNNAVNTWTDNNIVVNGATSGSVVANSTINSLRFTSAQAVTLAGQLTVRSGMIVFPAVLASGGMTISGGSLTTGNGQDLIFFDNYNNTNQTRKTISSTITGSNALTYSGSNSGFGHGGYLALNNNSNAIGDIYVSGGVLESLQSGSLGATATARTLYLLGGGISFESGTTQNYDNTALTVGASGGTWTDAATAGTASATISSFGGTVTLNGNLLVSNIANARLGLGTRALTGGISGPGSLRLVTTSRITLGGNNSAWTGGMTISAGGQVRFDSANAAGTAPIFNGDSTAGGIGIVEFTNNFGTTLTNDLLVSGLTASNFQQGTGFLISNAKTGAAVTLSGRIASNGLTFQGYDSGSAVSETVLSSTVATSGTPINRSYGDTTTIQNFINGQSGITLGVTAFAASSTTALAYGTSGFLAYNAGTTTGVTNGAEGYVRFAPDANGNLKSFLPGAVGPGYVAALRKGGASTLNFGYLLTGASSGSALAGTTASGSNVITGISSTAGYAVGQTITGTNIPGGTTIVRIIDGTSLVLSSNATGAGAITDLAISGSGNAYALPEGKSFVIGTLGSGAGQTGTFGATGTGTNTATFLGNPKAAAGQLLAGFNGGDINIHANAATDTATLNLSARNAGDTLVLGDGVTAANNVVITPTWGDSGASSAVTLLRKRTGATTLKKVGAGTLEIKGVNLTHTDGTDASGVFTWDVNVGTLKLNGTGVNTTILTDGNTATTSDILISGGTLELAASEQIANTGSINMSSGAFNFGTATGKTETIDKFTNSGGTFTTGANILIGLGNTITWSGGTNTVNNGGSVQDAHIVISGGTNTVEGGATGGVLQLNASGTGLEMSAGSTLTLNSDNAVAGKLLLKGDVSTSGATTVTIASGLALTNKGNIDLDNGTRTFTVADGAAATDMSISAVITNGSIIKDGAGTLSLDAANTYTGTTAINNGTLIANVLGALPLTPRSAVSFTGGGNPALSLGANQVAASLTSVGATTGTVTLGSNTLTVGAGSGSTDFKGSIGGAGNLIKDDASTQVLSGTNAYTGTTTVSGGTLEVQGSLSGTTGVTVNTGGTLLMNSAASNIVNTTATVAMAGGTLAFGNAANQTQNLGALTLTANSTLDFGAGGGNDKFHFAGFVNTAGTLAITNWLGNDAGGTDGAHDRLVFTGLFTDFTSSFSQSQISFNGTSGYAAIDFGGTSYEIVPVPEPATTALIGSIALCALVGYRERRRFTGLGKRMAARK